MTVQNWREACDDSCCADAGDPMTALRELGRYSQTWTWGDLIERMPDEDMTRSEMDRQLIARAHDTKGFLGVLRSQTRFAYMVAAHNAFQIPKLEFLQQIREVRLLEETESLLYLVIPFRSELQARLERGAGDAGSSGDHGGAPDRREIEARMLKRSRDDQAFHQALLFEPSSTYRRFAQERSQGVMPAFLEKIREIRIIPETRDSLALVRPIADPSLASQGGRSVTPPEA